MNAGRKAGAPLHPLGLITATEAFELQRPGQVEINVSGTCDAARNAYLETVLEFLSAGSPPLVISRTDIDTTVRSGFANGASLWLPVGKYRWTGRVRPNTGGTISAPDITGHVVIYNDPANPVALGRCGVSGSANGFCLVSVKAQTPVMARASAYTQLKAGDTVTLSLLIGDLQTGNGVQTPVAEIIGPNPYPLQTEATPYYLPANRIYRFSYDMTRNTSADVSCSISIGSG